MNRVRYQLLVVGPITARGHASSYTYQLPGGQ